MGDPGLGQSQIHGIEQTVLPTEEVSVLVTGFGPFKAYAANASNLISSSLPSSFTFPSAAPSFAPQEGLAPTSRRISIHVHPTPIPVAYSTIREIVPVILDEYAKNHGGRRPDIVIHMGIAATRDYYSVETQAHRDAYHLSDITGRSGFLDGEMHWRQLGLPPILKAGRATNVRTTVNAPAMETPGTVPGSKSQQAVQQHTNPRPPDDQFVDIWKTFAPPGADIRISQDAGRYACEFILYTSLAQAFQEGRDRNVTFFHVPPSCNDEDIEYGRNVAIAFIKALVTSWFDEKAT
ncbi:putative pyroglutamyl peptidase type I [Aspergillus chevalieri]|uniref:Pyroglutamyl peptidase type I n=1 Tax=Aspergillus chevalieri TaxID=182096 RepID=A0A7R7VXT9_ASPCH|nr:uncharacterized protein ACHE_80600A [Aspergillus chevalieri]BCR92700.1 hypothetical protein ACHE_80600A [Aspergillus chevalieri]